MEPTFEKEPPRLAQLHPWPTRPEQPVVEEAAGERQRPRLRVLIVDRHRMEADGIQRVFEQHPDLEVAGIATNSREAVALAAATRPDVILADYQLPDSTGAELAARLRKDEPATHVLMLSSVASDPLLQESVKAGAKGFLLRTQPAEDLVEAVRRAGAGEMLIPAVRLAAMVVDHDRGAQLFDQLTGREREVLRLLAAGLDNKAIAARMGIGYVTVRSHVRNLCSKLDARSRLEVLAKASELGLIGRS
jgi:DNA-binding NarL/FixJ family response regulator